MEDQHTEKGDYGNFVILDETCAIMVSVEYAVAMARLRIKNRGTVCRTTIRYHRAGLYDNVYIRMTAM